MSNIILRYCKNYSYKTIFLTGTPFVNFPCDISQLINTITTDNKLKLPITKEKFENKFYEKNSK